MTEDVATYDGDASRAFYRELNRCRCCGRTLYTTEEIAELIGVSRRSFYRWLAGTGSARKHETIVLWLAQNTDKFTR